MFLHLRFWFLVLLDLRDIKFDGLSRNFENSSRYSTVNAAVFIENINQPLYNGNCANSCNRHGPHCCGSFCTCGLCSCCSGKSNRSDYDATYPFLCRMAGREETSVETWTKRILFRSVVIVSVFISIGLFTCAPYIIWGLGGDKFGDAVLVLRMIAVLPLFMALSRTFGTQTMLPLRMDREYT